MAGSTLGKMGRFKWLRSSDWQSLLFRNGPVHYWILKFAGLSQQIYNACFCQCLRTFLFIRPPFCLKSSREKFIQVISSSFLVNPLQNAAESRLLVLKTTGKFSCQNLPISRKNLMHEKTPTLLALFSFRRLNYWFLLNNSQQIDFSLYSVPVKALDANLCHAIRM